MTTPQRVASAATVVLLACIATPAVAQSSPTRIEEINATEAFVHTGIFGAGSDEGRIGTGISFGGTLTVPLTRRLAADLDVQTSHVRRTMGHPDDIYTSRRTLLIPSLLWRFGVESVYGYVGGGIGAESDHAIYTRAGLVTSEQHNQNHPVSFRSGVTAFPARRFGLRADVYMAGWHLGARIGFGYRFQ